MSFWVNTLHERSLLIWDLSSSQAFILVCQVLQLLGWIHTFSVTYMIDFAEFIGLKQVLSSRNQTRHFIGYSIEFISGILQCKQPPVSIVSENTSSSDIVQSLSTSDRLRVNDNSVARSVFDVRPTSFGFRYVIAELSIYLVILLSTFTLIYFSIHHFPVFDGYRQTRCFVCSENVCFKEKGIESILQIMITI